MPSALLLEMADFYADLSARWPADDVATQCDLAERLHMLATGPERATYAEVDADGVPAIRAIPVVATREHVLLRNHLGGSVVSSMHMDRKDIERAPKDDAAVAEMAGWLRTKLGETALPISPTVERVRRGR